MQGKRNEMTWAQHAINQAKKERQKLKDLNDEEAKINEKLEELKDQCTYVQNKKKQEIRLKNLFDCKESKIRDRKTNEVMLNNYSNLGIVENLEDYEGTLQQLSTEKSKFEAEIRLLQSKIDVSEQDKGNMQQNIGRLRSQIDFYCQKMNEIDVIRQEMIEFIGETDPEHMIAL